MAGAELSKSPGPGGTLSEFMNLKRRPGSHKRRPDPLMVFVCRGTLGKGERGVERRSRTLGGNMRSAQWLTWARAPRDLRMAEIFPATGRED